MNTIVNKKRTLVFLLLTASLAGCVVAPAPRYVASADVRIVTAPPAPRVEVLPPPPAPHYYWISGHWRWVGNRYDWEPGHWVEPRPDAVFVQAYWTEERGQWIYHAGHWAHPAPHPEIVEVVAVRPPPAPRVEVIPAPPSPNHFWVAGYWRWEQGQHHWVAGRWEVHRPGHVWINAHWVQSGANWRLSGGFWERL
jgi:hypothetical protein